MIDLIFDQLINRPRSVYQYSNMAPRLPGQTSIFGVVFFVSKSLLGIREFKITTTATATGTSLNKRFNEQNNGCARAL